MTAKGGRCVINLSPVASSCRVGIFNWPYIISRPIAALYWSQIYAPTGRFSLARHRSLISGTAAEIWGLHAPNIRSGNQHRITVAVFTESHQRNWENGLEFHETSYEGHHLCSKGDAGYEYSTKDTLDDSFTSPFGALTYVYRWQKFEIGRTLVPNLMPLNKSTID